MVMAPEDTGVENHPVVYAGRYADSLAGVDLPDGCTVLDDWEVLPLQLAPVLERAATLVVLDIFSFPFDAMTHEQWDVPLVPVIPDGFDADFLEAVFGVPLFERLGFLDHLIVRDGDLWQRLRARYGWAESRRIEVEGGLEDVVTEVLARLETESSVPTFFGGDEYEALPYWKERGTKLAASVSHRAICSVHHGPRFNKAMHRAQAAVLEPLFLAARGGRDESSPFEVLEVGAGVGRWAQSFDFSGTRFSGLDISGSMVEAARANFPEGRFDHLGDDMVFPYDDESFDLVFSVTVMHHNQTPAKLALISEMWRVARPGGRLLFLEAFVSGERTEKSTVYPMSVTKFAGVLLEATNGQVLLEHVESLRYPHDAVVRGGALAVSKLGAPKKW
ncbi:MAG: class I SAM-dependent methyltransferase [Rubrobacteraceae bacterium]